ncbi:hypothetical protein [Methanogenium sp. MK-MG]|uniref:hypothetical protein n=1 Tax=Methanogenium sp. MK-MG TaxID=2599926 RepID=UPI0013EB978B|nr:hypothetical protein [Methanogenium sp. MK-MG]KAF1076432.1 hypothetical protein MKMG_01478 [Methanogenium sp. MK-MG]
MRTHEILIILLFIALAIAAPATARYVSPEGSNAGINPGDTVFNGEQGINFSKFQPPLPLAPPLWLACDDGGSALAMQTLDNRAVMTGRINVESAYIDRPFRLYNGSWGDAICTVSGPSGTIEVRTGTALGTDVDPSITDTKTPAIIPATINVQFKLDATNLNNGNFINPWYEYELRTPGGVPLSTVTNMAGTAIPITGLTGNPSASNNTLAFSIADQNLNPEEGTYVMRFTAYNGNNAFYTADYPFDVVRYFLTASVSPATVQEDETTTLTITGKPFTHYTIAIEDAMDGKPELQPSGNYDIYVDKYNAIVHPDWSGTVSVPLYLPPTDGDSSSTTRIYYPKVYETGNPSTYVTAQIVVEPGKTQDIVLYDNKLGDDEYYCLGDKVKITGTLGAPAKHEMELYFYLKGLNLDLNGANPSNPSISVIDGDNSTFDAITISKGQMEFSYDWVTGNIGLTPDTYTIFATTKPQGYNSRPLSENEVKDYISFDLNQPSINVKFPNEAPGFFAQGDHIVSLWTARGSPAQMGYNGKIRYYIFGENFKYTNLREFPLLKIDTDTTQAQLKVLAEINDFPGYSGLDLPRSFSSNISSGEYIIVYQHPMYNQKFDLLPVEGDAYTGFITKVVTSDNKAIDISTLQAPEAVNALKSALKSPSIDDTLVTQTCVIEKPLVNIQPILNFEVGEQILVTGTTNLECPISYTYNQIDLPGDRILFTIYSADMYYSGKTQSTNRIFSDESYPRKTKTGAASRDISFTIPVDISQKMKPGDYIAVIKCEDIKYETMTPFTLHEEGYRKEHGAAAPGTGEEFSQNPVVASEITSTPEPQSRPVHSVTDVPTQTPEQTAGFGSIIHVISIMLAFCVLPCIQRR